MTGLCFPTLSDVEGTISQIFNATDIQHVEFKGEWIIQQDPQGFSFKVSGTTGDKATAVFTGIAVQVVGRMGLDGIHALFGLDLDGLEGGGVSCYNGASTGSIIPQNIPLFDLFPTSLSQGTHILFITNQGSTLSLHNFEVFTSNGEMATSTSHLTFVPPTTTPPPNTPALTTSTSDSLSNGLSSKTSLPVVPSGSSLLYTISSYMQVSAVSSYMQVSSVNGTTTTLVNEITIEVQKPQGSHGLPRGVLAGVVVGGAFLPLLIVGASLWCRRCGSRLRIQKATTGLLPNPNMTAKVAMPATKAILFPGPPRDPTSQRPVAPLPSRKTVRTNLADAALSPSESGEEGSCQPSDPTAPHISSTIAEASFILEDGPSGVAIDADRQIVATNTEANPYSYATSAIHPDFQASPPAPVGGPGRGGVPDTATVARGEGNDERAGARVMWLLIEEDSGVRLAGWRLGEARGEEAGSGEWEVLPPPYQEF